MKIAFLHQHSWPYVRRDLDILRTAHDVCEVQMPSAGRWGVGALRDLLNIWRAVRWCDLSFSWIGSLHAFAAVLFSRLLGKKAIVVAGGDDVANEPEINYGMFAFWYKRWCPLFAFRQADLVLAVSEHNRLQTIENTGADPDKVKLLYHGFAPLKWQRMADVPKEDTVLTVGRVTGETLHVKGLELYVESARYAPAVPFVLVGPWEDGAIERLREIAAPNVRFTGGLYGDDLVRMYSQAKVYVQVSAHESFGCSLAEAMLCECVPVVSRRAALPEVAGTAGFFVDDLSPQAVAAQIKRALDSGTGRQAREQIVRAFPLEERRQALLAAISEVMNP
jgi:glycosyltransferase involved in cell wall biosynthesis